ncbi:hypothetical protein LZ31DRAFT_162549 [Colletotrichum somersetense]|nr:hypothetical protein LZ31DRAFT_162549 [Colletotrichum somersetense]
MTYLSGYLLGFPELRPWEQVIKTPPPTPKHSTVSTDIGVFTARLQCVDFPTFLSGWMLRVRLRLSCCPAKARRWLSSSSTFSMDHKGNERLSCSMNEQLPMLKRQPKAAKTGGTAGIIRAKPQVHCQAPFSPRERLSPCQPAAFFPLHFPSKLGPRTRGEGDWSGGL